ncbi:hypothetical protein G7B40_024965 [Aetokthonos hydrillicola Thurmond2011]|jgi:hypothetical protein|uniref:Uncharacterized protein n=1 Tax=Aetokthonos hydrillicola Thurmond2011 TaxID=2712845 RepID=A0AAP5ICM4_9CYAN|nr:hypothetical protein [Aetokthonos hydrillicola]MBO3458492.1 hypothetical protein [Aetokthonos hydrillicola CCALA 1050]MBW4586181.1 hypothetical protein [Aetokthonos hydrillicola CCALA 1050]MDR9897789.1 hypothetical protein [Aetokthonos hydrillicola Thurmond2011]
MRNAILPTPKRLVMTNGDARVGKSTTARLLVELYLESKLKLGAYYTGERNKLYAYELLLPVNELPLTQGGADQLLIDLERFSDFQAVLSDLPGQNFEQFKQFAKEVMLWDAIASLGYRITFIHPISYRRDCVEYLQKLFDYCGNHADYVVLKNLYFGNEFPYFDGTDIQKWIQEIGGEELYLGELWRGTYELVESLNLPYSQAMQNPEIDIINRSRIFNWMEEFNEQIKNNKNITNLLALAQPESSLNIQQQLDCDF